MEDELITSKLLYCAAFARLRLKHRGCHTLYEPGELAGADSSRLNKFVAGSKRFVDMRWSFLTVISSAG